MRATEIIDNPAFEEALSSSEQAWLAELVTTDSKGRDVLMCLSRKKEIIAKPEEILRQLWLRKLVNDYG